ncbi:MAG: helix-turn-helix transcriptional regulator [Acidiferrobacter sp.]
MSKPDDLYRLHRLLDGRRNTIGRQALIDKLEISRSKLTRLIADLRDRFGAPLVFDANHSGYRYDTTDGHHPLPGLWFTSEELYALVTLDHLLQTLQPGLLDDALAPIRARLNALLQTEHLGGGEARKRIRILTMASRAKDMRHFQNIAGAVLQRKRLIIQYYNRERGQTSEREISPQRLTHYRDNWYLDAWCHQKQGLRIFAVECIRETTVLGKAAKLLSNATLNDQLASAYGIFAGQPVATAILRFTAYRARWVADETWHPDQQSRWLEDGRYELSVPYSRDTELIMDILKYGPDVEVIAPDGLRETVKIQLDQARGQYG